MRYRLMATYQGVPYEAGIGPSDGDVVLFAACPPPEELGFEPATGHWRKQLRIADVQALWESKPMGTFRGEQCIILDELGDRLHIAYLGHDAYQAEQLGYWQVDRGVFELVAPREEVADVIEERADYPQLSAATATATAQPPLSPAPGTASAASFSPAVSAPGLIPAAADPGMASAALHADFRTDSEPHLAPPDRFGAAPEPVPSVLPQSYPELPSYPTPAYPGPPPDARQARYPAPPDASPAPYPMPPYHTPPTGSEIPAGFAVPPPYQEAPLPLEAAALRATSAASRRQPKAPEPAGPPPPRRRRAEHQRVATQRVFSELANLAAIPTASYAVGAEVDGAMCLLQTEDGFEVFNAVAGARHEVRVFGDEESAYFYLFGVLAAEAVRTGGLVPHL